MFQILRVLALAIGIGSLGLSLVPAQAQELPEPERSVALAALAAAHSGDWSRAYAEAERCRDRLPLKLVQWLDYTRSVPGGRFAEIADFIEHNPDWPDQKALEHNAEAAIVKESDDTVAAWFKNHAPISAVGKVRRAELMMNRGQVTDGAELLRNTWVEDDFPPAAERDFWGKYGGAMRPEDNEARLERLLWDRRDDAARRMIPLVPADYQALAEARLALAAGAPNAGTAVARVPPSLQSDPGLVFDEVRWDNRKDMIEPAAQLLLAHPNNRMQPAAWWAERDMVARRLLATGAANLAYRIVQQHGAVAAGSDSSEAEFLAGYIALRYFKKPQLAFDHFARILARVTSPYAKARAAYWSGRAAAAEGKRDLAMKWYAAGAESMATFYGQLAAHELGRDAPPHPVPEPRPDAAELARFDANEQVQAAALLAAAGERHSTKIFVAHLARTAHSQIDFAMLAAFAETHGRIDLAILVAGRAMAAGTPLMVHGYPIIALPPGDKTIEPSLLYAIVRQESAFDQYAVSSAGALGLMQLMPATAARIAQRMQVGFSPARLTQDGAYNVLLGRSYLEGLLDDFGGSYALAIASYNAGPGRVREWLRDYGDPRGGDISMVDWIENIPFTETRLYVQRVLENLQVYRGQNQTNATAFSLVSDLAR